MSITIVPVESQASGGFNNGAILENKPIGFPDDGGSLRPYSSLFYWAHAWTPGAESLIGEHPHRGFEIMTFVLKGTIEHYDDKNDNWRTLSLGDAQIIRAGSGIRHAERMHTASEMFQIWLDPDLGKTMSRTPSYDDYRASSFPVREEAGMRIKTYHGGDAPMQMVTPGIGIREIDFSSGRYTLSTAIDRILSAYVLLGDIEIDEHRVSTKDFVIVEEQNAIEMVASADARLFVIESPADVPYETFAHRRR